MTWLISVITQLARIIFFSFRKTVRRNDILADDEHLLLKYWIEEAVA